jgi:hypothetical protein
MNRITARYKGLQFTPVWFEDKSLTSPDYFQITEFPLRLTAGKNLFKLRGHPSNLRVGGPLNFEVLDYNGDPIHSEVIRYVDEDSSRVIAIYIYDDTSPGDCTITIVAEADNVPSDWRGRYNVKWTRTVPVNPNVSNVSEIIFETPPVINITEQIGPHLDRTFVNNTQFPTYATGSVKYFSYNQTPAVEISGGKFINDMATGIITVSSPATPTPTPTYPASTTEYSSTIKKVLSPTLALLDKEFVVYSSNSISPHTYNQFDYSAFSLKYEASPVYTQTQNSESYALIEIQGLQPATGDISRIKVFMNNTGTVGTWEQINDIELSETELFVGDTGSIKPDTSIGLFTSQSIINTYWEGYTYIGKTTSTAPALTQTTASLGNAMQIVNSVDISNKNTVSIAQVKSSYAATFIKDSQYKITLDALGTSNNNSDTIISLYLSGSAFSYDTTDYYNQEFSRKFGKRVGELKVTTDNQRFDDVVFNFTADNTGTAVLLLVVENGAWQVADIRTTSDNDAGYTPNYTRIKTLVPTAHKSNNQISFKLEYYNVNGEKSKYHNIIYNKSWEGGNRYIDGDYSMLTGSLYVADSLESGIAISGYSNSGFVRSLGYDGFAAGNPGFLLWSGSAMSGSAGTKGGGVYSGVGLEMYANTSSYFRYSTTDSEIDVRTDKFFFGNPSTSFISGSNGNMQLQAKSFLLGDTASQYISGSNGLLQISSSNFLLSSSGDIFANNGVYYNSSQSDIFIYRLIDLNDDSFYNYYYPSDPVENRPYSTYTLGGQSYISLNLTGSRRTGVSGRGAATFIRINSQQYPIGQINIHPNTFYTGSGGGGISPTYYQNFGATLIIEAATDVYLSSNANQSYYSDSYIAADSDDMFYPAFKTYTALGDTYTDTIKIHAGTQVFLVQSKFAWRIVAMSSTTYVPVLFNGGLHLGNLPTSNPGGSGIVWNDGGTLKIT